MIYYLSKSLIDYETRYSRVEKLALAMVIVVQNFHHCILLRTTNVLADQNPMYYILTHRVLGGKYSCWIVILQEFDLEFSKDILKKSLVLMELICDLCYDLTEDDPDNSFSDEFLFLISTIDPWYGYLIIYL